MQGQHIDPWLSRILAARRWLAGATCLALLGLAGCSSSGGSANTESPPATSSANVVTSATAAASSSPSVPPSAQAAAAVPFGSDITSPDSNVTYTGAFPAGPDGRSTILTYQVNGDQPGVVWQLVDASGRAGTLSEGTLIKLDDNSPQTAPRMACGMVATTLHGAASVSSLYFVGRPAQGVVPAEYDAYLYTWDGSGGSNPLSQTMIADHVQGVPTCDVDERAGVVTSGRSGNENENQWSLDGTTTSRNDALVSYHPASQDSKDSTTKHVFVSIDNGTVTPIVMKNLQSMSFVVGDGVIGSCGPEPWSAKPCSLSLKGTTASPSVSCDGSANCTYSTLFGSDGLAVDAEHPNIQSSESFGRVLDPLTGAVKFSLGDVPYPSAAVYDKETDTIIVLGDKNNAVGDGNTVVGFDAKNGTKLWTVNATKLCGSNASGILVTANGQLALLSPRDGKQIASTADVHDCTPGPGAGIGISDNGQLVSLLSS